MLFILVFANNTILLCSFFFVLIIDLQFLIPAVVTQVFNPIAELVISIGILNKEQKAEIEIHPVTAEAKINKCLVEFRVAQTSFYFLLINSFCYIFSLK